MQFKKDSTLFFTAIAKVEPVFDTEILKQRLLLEEFFRI